MKKGLALGSGFVSGYVSIFLAILSFLAIFCFKYPEWLTTPEFREVYTGESMKILLSGVLIASFFFAVLSFILSKKKKLSLYAILIGTASVFLGGFQVTPSDVTSKSFHLGLDWLLLDLLLMAVIFIPIEMVFPKRENQSQFHPEWKTDLIPIIKGISKNSFFYLSNNFLVFFKINIQFLFYAIFLNYF